MGIEIERKFLVINNQWRGGSPGILYRQGYLSMEKKRVVRIRCAGSQAFLTIKGPSTGRQRLEYEYEIPQDEANELMDELCIRPIIEKYRYKVAYAGLIWEIDEFLGKNQGLVLAEVELEESEQKVDLPNWIGEEVTGDPKYYNVNLVSNPFNEW
jgi:adenylate cyclase